MPRALAIAAGLLPLVVAGTITTVAIAWASVVVRDPVLVVGGPVDVFARPDGVTSEPQYIVLDRAGTPGLVCWSVIYRSTHSQPPPPEQGLRDRVDRWAEPFVRPRLPQDGCWPDYPFIRPIEVAFVVGAGWPRSALMYATTEATPARSRSAWTTVGGLELTSLRHSRTGSATILPLRPIWDGLVIDTAFWAAAWSLVALAASRARRWWRRSRGRCAMCGYDLRGLAPGATCPECGHPASNRRASPAPSATALTSR